MIADKVNREWLRYVLPLPKEIRIEGEVSVSPEAISVTVCGAEDAAVNLAAEQLRGLLGEGNEAGGKAFEIVLGTVDSHSRLGGKVVDEGRLAGLPNREQAYVIRPDGRGRLLLAGLEGVGAAYAACTLGQLLGPFTTKAHVRIPLLSVTDWPDVAERGLWNFPDPANWIPWLAGMKLNYGKMASTELTPVERGAPNRATIDSGLMLAARARGFNYLPYVLHLNFLHDCGLFRVYPELAGVGDGALCGRYFAHKGGNQHRAPCASQPLLRKILAEWMADIARQGATEVSCWLSERPAQCECGDCTRVGQFVLEARAFAGAWREVREAYPDFGMRIFLSTTTTGQNYRILSELAPEVKVERACATHLERVSRVPRDLMANPLMDACAAEGRWVASYDVPLGANGRVDTPEFKVPHRSAHRIRDYVGQLVRRGYSGAYGMMAWATQARTICGYNIAALAEWSWNAGGRDTRSFAESWAAIEGCADPEAFGDWAELVGPVAFDVCDSDWPICYSWGKAVRMVERHERPVLGEGMFRYYESESSFGEKRTACESALDVAREMSLPHLEAETRVLVSYVDLAEAVYRAAEANATLDMGSLDDQGVLERAADALRKAGVLNGNAIRAWRKELGPEPWHHRVHDAIRAGEETAERIADHLEDRYLY